MTMANVDGVLINCTVGQRQFFFVLRTLHIGQMVLGSQNTKTVFMLLHALFKQRMFHVIMMLDGQIRSVFCQYS